MIRDGWRKEIELVRFCIGKPEKKHPSLSIAFTFFKKAWYCRIATVDSYDVTITGPNSTMVSGQLSTKLTGRYIEFPIYPLSLREFRDFFAALPTKTLVFGDRFPFRYLADDYGLTYYAAFVGCSAETEASFETIAFLAKKVDELKLPVVLTIEGNNHSIAETVVSSTQEKNQQILVMNSLQSVTEKDIADGESYLGIMTENLEVLKEALK